jgi:hypothetical protein
VLFAAGEKGGREMNYISIVIARFVVGIVASLTAAFVKAIKGDPAKSLCTYCAHAHIAIGQRPEQRKTSCTYRGVSHAVRFVVSDCSMFCPRNAPAQTVRVVGFAGFARVSEFAEGLMAAKTNL